MKLAIKISEEEAERLHAEADKKGVSPEELAKVAVVEMLDRNQDFAEAASYVLKKNRELYERLS